MAETMLSMLIGQIRQLHAQRQRAAQQINYWLPVHDWLIGCRIAEYEQDGSDRATYGERLLLELARQLRSVKGLAAQRLYNYRTFYREYPTILQTLSGELQSTGSLDAASLPARPTVEQPAAQDDLPGIAPILLLTRLSFSHFLELLALDRPLQRAFMRCRQ